MQVPTRIFVQLIDIYRYLLRQACASLLTVEYNEIKTHLVKFVEQAECVN